MAEQVVKGSPLRYNAGTQDIFVKEVNRTLINPMMKETEERVNSLFDEFAAGLLLFPVLNSRSRKILNEIEKRYGVIFKRQAERIGKAYVKDINNYSKAGVRRNVKALELGRTTAFKESKQNIEAISKTGENGVKLLLTGMLSFYMAKVRKQTEQAVITKSRDGVKDYLKRQRGITRRKAKNDSKDFYRQVFNAYNREYLQSNKIDKWQWVHTNRAQEPNKYHLNGLNGLTFEYDAAPPVIDQRTGARGYPGDWYGCQCIMLPVRTY